LQAYNYHSKGNYTSMTDIMILGATEIDMNFNGNVVTHSDGLLLHGIGGWQNCLHAKTVIIPLFPLICLFCMIGAYSLNNRASDMLIMTIFGVLGYLMRKYKYEAAPLVLALVLVPMMEAALRRSLLLSNGDPMIFITRPLSGFIMVSAAALIIFSLVPVFNKKRGTLDKILKEGEDS
ncbi:MAG: tripartite tricarboxylate transporter permease, partial [Syntrophales bacterium]|nr:tripartite tricarboxylate transporter permease [Syntrophales bacterium]